MTCCDSFATNKRMKTQVSALSPKTSRFPISITEGDVEARIYRTPTRVRGTKYDTFTLCWHLNGRRHRRRFSDLDQAKAEGERIVREKSQGALAVAAFSAGDRVALESALVELAKAEGTGSARASRIVEIVRDYAAAAASLPKGATLGEAVRFYAARHPANMQRKTVAEVVAEFIADREGAGCSEIYLHDLRVRLGQQFAAAFVLPMGTLTAPLVQAYIYGLKNTLTGKPASNRSKENMLRCIVSVANFARRMKYIPAELAFEIAEIPAPKKQPAPVGIYSPEEIRSMLAGADAEVVPALAIAAFAGLRLAEVARLDWREIRLSERLIVIEADKAKTAARRLVTISDNLAAWLAPHAQRFGPVNPCLEAGNVGHGLGIRLMRIAARANVPWKRNALRHSYISYRTATLKDVPAVALECGNSPAMIFSNYRALASEAEGKAWFDVFPPKAAENVVNLGLRLSAATGQ